MQVKLYTSYKLYADFKVLTHRMIQRINNFKSVVGYLKQKSHVFICQNKLSKKHISKEQKNLCNQEVFLTFNEQSPRITNKNIVNGFALTKEICYNVESIVY